MPHIHDLIDFTVGALIVYDGRVCLVHHRELGLWVTPGGHIELDEDPDQALWREIEEETGLRPDDLEILSERSHTPGDDGAQPLYVPRWMNIHSISPGHRHIVFDHVFRSKTDRLRLADGEHHEIRWFSSTELDDPALKIPKELRFYAKEAIRLAA